MRKAVRRWLGIDTWGWDFLRVKTRLGKVVRDVKEHDVALRTLNNKLGGLQSVIEADAVWYVEEIEKLKHSDEQLAMNIAQQEERLAGVESYINDAASPAFVEVVRRLGQLEAEVADLRARTQLP